MSFEDYKEAKKEHDVLAEKVSKSFTKCNDLRKTTDIKVILTVAEIEDLINEFTNLGTVKSPFETIVSKLNESIEQKSSSKKEGGFCPNCDRTMRNGICPNLFCKKLGEV